MVVMVVLVMVRTNEGVIDFLDGVWYLDDGDIWDENVGVDDSDRGGVDDSDHDGDGVDDGDEDGLGLNWSWSSCTTS